ncbi:hypothetical protein D8L93_00565 [Sodalis-like symbiont of Bactericera trigonica]|nr:hypothetical protein D8L93_00565 [Sodalis-like symbiont of Bactericera trigonica]
MATLPTWRYYAPPPHFYRPPPVYYSHRPVHPPQPPAPAGAPHHGGQHGHAYHGKPDHHDHGGGVARANRRRINTTTRAFCPTFRPGPCTWALTVLSLSIR